MVPQKLKELIAEGRAGTVDYPTYVTRLREEAGVTHYRADVRFHTVTFRDFNEAYVERSTITEAAAPSPFNEAALKQAIADQTSGSDYDGFLTKIWAAGIQRYDVDLVNRNIVYRGANGEEYLEQIP